MIDTKETVLLINQAELHLRNARRNLTELGRALDTIRRAL